MIGAIIQARMGATRLPGKIMLNILNKPVLWHVVNRVSKSKYIDKIVVATTVNERDDVVCDFCKKNGFDFFRGSEDDVLDRFYQCAKEFNIDTIVRITSDCPLHDPQVIDKIVNQYINGSYDYVSNVDPPTYPDGLDVEVFSYTALEKAWKEAKLKSEREHVTPYIRKNNHFFKIGSVKNEEDLSSHRWTLDQSEDLIFIQAIYNGLKKDVFYMADVLELIDKHPEILKINSNIIRNEGYIKSLNKDEVVKL